MVFAKTLLGIDLLTDNPEAYISMLVEQVDWTALRDHTELESCLILQNEDVFSPTELDTVFSSFILMPVYSQVSEPFKRFILCFFDERDAIDLMKIYTLESSRQLLDLALERALAINSLIEFNADLHLLNETLTTTQNQLIESEKLASLGMLSAGVAHEINNPLAFINSNFESLQFYVTNLKNSILELRNFVLKDDDDMSQAFVDNLWRINKLSFIFEDSEELLDSSKDGVNRVKNIVADLKAFSRMDNQELEAVDLDKAITSSLNIVTNELKYEYEVKLDLNSTALIWGTVSQLQQVFVNLLVNAKDAMPDGGVIHIKTVRQGNRIYVHLKDYGVGMNKEQQQNMFTPFYTTKRVGEGTGLGLSISYSILQQHHAKVEVISELGKGTEFILGFLVCDG
jgi:signal transduction histidine kinase